MANKFNIDLMRVDILTFMLKNQHKSHQFKGSKTTTTTPEKVEVDEEKNGQIDFISDIGL